MANTQLTTAEFFGTPISVIDHAGRRWLTAEQAGRCLGYNDANARQGINNLFKRHEDEFTEEDTFVINLMTNPQGGNPNTRIFSATGCQKLGFFASTARAKDFRTWAAKVLAGQAPAPVVADARLDRLDANMAVLAGHVGTLAAGMQVMSRQLDVTAKYIGLLEINQVAKRKITPEIAAEAKALAAEGMNFADIGRLLRISRTSVSLLVRDLYPQHRLESTAPAQPSTGDILEGWIEREQQRLAVQLAKTED